MAIYHKENQQLHWLKIKIQLLIFTINKIKKIIIGMLMLSQQRERNRQFFCSCGKGYYSYAALFTHIKQKHEGKAPGPIIKPKPENKRGRPRKKLHSRSDKQDNQQGGASGSQSSNQLNSNNRLNNILFPLKSTPGSKFKSYKADSPIPIAHSNLNSERFESNTLLLDLTHHLEILPSTNVPQELLYQFSAYQILKGSDMEQQSLTGFLNRFLNFCQTGVKREYAVQIQLLVVLLLQHIMDSSNGNRIQKMKQTALNDYIQSFFANLPDYIEKWKLSPYSIFWGLNPTKVLVVLYNWFNQCSVILAISDRSQSSNSPQEELNPQF